MKFSKVVDKLQYSREYAWASLQPVFDWAIQSAIESEYEAARAANLAQTRVDPVYHPVVDLLVKATPHHYGSPQVDNPNG